MTTIADLSRQMPDTSGINFYTADPDLSYHMRQSLSTEDFERAQGILSRMGEVASQRMDELARVLERHASEPFRRRFLPALTAIKMDELKQGAMFLTEKQGGSDVGLTATIARPRPGENFADDTLQPQWELWGDKWFCSNVSADLILTLARPEGAPAGTRGLGRIL